MKQKDPKFKFSLGYISTWVSWGIRDLVSKEKKRNKEWKGGREEKKTKFIIWVKYLKEGTLSSFC